MNSFSTLLRLSRLARFDSKLPRPVAAPSRHRSAGDYGLKRPFPTTLTARQLLPTGKLDSIHHQTPFKPDARDSLYLSRLQENFPPLFTAPLERKRDPVLQVASLPERIWKRWLKEKVLEKRSEWEKDSMDALGFLAGAKSQRQAPEYEYIGATQETTGLRVRGRILNRVPEGHAVGVGGVVCLLPSCNAPQLANRLVSSKVMTFAVVDVKWPAKPHLNYGAYGDEAVVPEVTLSLNDAVLRN